MRSHQPRHTLSPSHRHVYHGRRALVGRLVVLSALLLVFGATSARADEPCTSYTGRAKRHCAQAVAAGCFDGVQSPDCHTLTNIWNEACSECPGLAPWGPSCPCVESIGQTAEDLHAELLSMGYDIAFVTCKDTRETVSVHFTAWDPDGEYTPFFTPMGVSASTLSDGVNRCIYYLNDALGFPVYPSVQVVGITTEERGACRKDIRALIDQLNTSSLFCGFQTTW